MDQPAVGPPREKRLLHRQSLPLRLFSSHDADSLTFSCSTLAVAYSKAQQTMGNPCYNSDTEQEPDDQAVHDLRSSAATSPPDPSITLTSESPDRHRGCRPARQPAHQWPPLTTNACAGHRRAIRRRRRAAVVRARHGRCPAERHHPQTQADLWRRQKGLAFGPAQLSGSGAISCDLILRTSREWAASLHVDIVLQLALCVIFPELDAVRHARNGRSSVPVHQRGVDLGLRGRLPLGPVLIGRLVE